MHSIAVAGHICVDIRPELDTNAQLAQGRLIEIGPLAMSLGGSVGNTGLDLAGLGLPVRLVTSVGDDELGGFVRASLAAQGRDVSGLDVVQGGSTSYSLILEPGGLDRTIWHNVGVNASFDGQSIDLAGIDLLHIGYPPLLPALVSHGGAPLDALLTRARSAGVTTSIDLADVDPESVAGRLDWESLLSRAMAKTDIVSPSIDDLTSALRIDEPFSPLLVERLQKLLLGWGAAVVALSAGRNGLFIRTAGRERLEASGRALASNAAAWADVDMQVPPVWQGIPATTNGAGDASTAGLLYGIAVGAGAQQSGLLAAACSGVIVSGGSMTPESVCALCPPLGPLFAMADKA